MTETALDSFTPPPFWKGLFSTGGFAWQMKMRKGEAREFFRHQDKRLMDERRRWLKEAPERCVVVTERGKALVEAAWEMALEFGQVDRPAKGEMDLPALAERWEPDLLMMEMETGTLAAGCVCLPSSWDLRQWRGRKLEEIHAVVPRLSEQIGAQIARFLGSLQPGKTFRRENWSLTRSAELNYHPELARTGIDDGVSLSEIFLRVEQQLFTGLPGGVLMGIRIVNCPLRDLAACPETWATFAEKLATMPPEVARYKNLEAGIAAVLREMERFAPINR